MRHALNPTSAMAIVVTAVLMSITCGCGDHKAIVCPDDIARGLTLEFLWDKAPGADPAGMTVYFFPDDGRSKLWRFDIGGRDGGPVELPVGSYRMLAFNNDLPGVRFDGTTAYDAFHALTVGAAGNQVRPTGMLYGVAMPRVEVTLCGVTYRTAEGTVKNCPFGIVRCHPDSLSTIYTTTFRNVKGLERVRSAKATLSGPAEILYLSDSRPTGPQVSTTFNVTKDSGALLTGRTSGLGTPSDVGSPVFGLQLAVTRTDGKSLLRKFDVTRQVLNSPSSRNVSIVIDGLEIPEGDLPPQPPDSSQVGIDVGVDGWTEINIDLSLDLP